ncbi:MAG: hypothetical protein COC15_02620 [Legionellales bacterium]|nr:MAG: hypothetical protein COC15_02620 [Legionellales bacterium]
MLPGIEQNILAPCVMLAEIIAYKNFSNNKLVWRDQDVPITVGAAIGAGKYIAILRYGKDKYQGLVLVAAPRILKVSADQLADNTVKLANNKFVNAKINDIEVVVPIIKSATY